jgi:hypothetical protein
VSEQSVLQQRACEGTLRATSEGAGQQLTKPLPQRHLQGLFFGRNKPNLGHEH